MQASFLMCAATAEGAAGLVVGPIGCPFLCVWLQQDVAGLMECWWLVGPLSWCSLVYSGRTSLPG